VFVNELVYLMFVNMCMNYHAGSLSSGAFLTP
jgi:hypothetical protein